MGILSDCAPDDDTKFIKKILALKISLWFTIVFVLGAFYFGRYTVDFFPRVDRKTLVLEEQKKNISTPYIESKDVISSVESALGTADVKYSCVYLDDSDLLAKEMDIENMGEKDGFYYPTGRGNTNEGYLWFNNILKTHFKTIDIKYEITTKDRYLPPSLIWRLERPTEKKKADFIGKLWLPEYSDNSDSNSLWLVGFSHEIDLFGNTVRDIAEELPDPVKRNQANSLVIESEPLGNELDLKFRYSYVSDRTDISVLPFRFSKKVSMKIADLETAKEPLNMAIGTYKGNGIKITALEVCY